MILSHARSGSTFLTDLLNSHPCVSNSGEVPISPATIDVSHTIPMNTTKFTTITECLKQGNTPTFGLKNHATDILQKAKLTLEGFGELLRRYNVKVILYMRRNLLEEFISLRNLGVKKVPMFCHENSTEIAATRRGNLEFKCNPKFMNQMIHNNNVNINDLETHIHRRMTEEVTWFKQMSYLNQNYGIKGIIHSPVVTLYHAYCFLVLYVPYEQLLDNFEESSPKILEFLDIDSSVKLTTNLVKRFPKNISSLVHNHLEVEKLLPQMCDYCSSFLHQGLSGVPPQFASIKLL